MGVRAARPCTGVCEGCSEAPVEGSHMRPGATGFPGRSSYVPVPVEAWSPAANGAVSAARLAAGPELTCPSWLRSLVTVSS